MSGHTWRGWWFLGILVPLLAAPAPASTVGTCRPGRTVLCLDQGRFRLGIEWSGSAPSPAATAVSERAGIFTPAAGGPRVVVHLADGRADNGHLWLQQHAPSPLAYGLTLEDLQTGETRRYRHAGGDRAEADLYALREGFLPGTPALAATAARSCDGAVCLAGSQLRVAVRAGGVELVGEGAGEDTAVFRRGGDADPDVVVSVVDARDRDGSWWVLSSAPGGLESTIEITDLDSHLVQRLSRSGAQTELASLRGAPGIGVVLDAARAAHASIAGDGGALQAKSASGVVFTLTVPAGALSSLETITLTPLKSVQRLSFSPGLVGGVQIDPPNLRFAAAAQLRIVAPKPVPRAQETPFGYRAGGAQFFLYPAAIGAPGVVLNLTQTGGYGLASGKPGQQQAQLKHPPPHLQDQFEQKLWAVHSPLRQGRGLKTEVALSPTKNAAVEKFFTDVYQKSQAMLIDIAGSCAGRKREGPFAEAFIAQGQADGFSGTGDFAALQTAINSGNAKCYDDAAADCLAQKPTAVVPLLRAWYQLDAAGATNLVDPAKAAACLVFEFELNSNVKDSYPPLASQHKIDSKVTVRFAPPFHWGTAVPGSPNNYQKAELLGGITTADGCTLRYTQKFKPDNLSVQYLILTANYYNDEEGPLTRVAIAYDTGDPQAELESNCPHNLPPITTIYFDPLAIDWILLHSFEGGADGYNLGPLGIHGFIETRWSISFQADLFAQYTYNRRKCADTCDSYAEEVTNLNLFHRPGQ